MLCFGAMGACGCFKEATSVKHSIRRKACQRLEQWPNPSRYFQWKRKLAESSPRVSFYADPFHSRPGLLAQRRTLTITTRHCSLAVHDVVTGYSIRQLVRTMSPLVVSLCNGGLLLTVYIPFFPLRSPVCFIGLNNPPVCMGVGESRHLTHSLLNTQSPIHRDFSVCLGKLLLAVHGH